MVRGGAGELEGGWRSGLANLSSFSVNHQLAFAARPVTCSEKAAPSGLWKLGAKTNLARGLPEGLPHPLLTCRLCSLFFFFFLLGGASSRVARLRPSPPRPTAQRRVQSLDRPSPSRRSTGNSTASAWPRPLRRARLRARPSASGLGPSPAPSPAPTASWDPPLLSNNHSDTQARAQLTPKCHASGKR